MRKGSTHGCGNRSPGRIAWSADSNAPVSPRDDTSLATQAPRLPSQQAHHTVRARQGHDSQPAHSPLRAGHWEALPAATAAQTASLPERRTPAGKRTPQTEPTPPAADRAGSPREPHVPGRLQAHAVGPPGYFRRKDENASSSRSNPFSRESLPTASRCGPGPDQCIAKSGPGARMALASTGFGNTSSCAFDHPRLEHEIRSHSVCLAHDPVGAGVEELVEKASVGGNPPRAQIAGNRGVLAYDHACFARKERPQQQDQEVQMRHPRQDHVRFKLPHQSQQGKRRGAHSSRPQRMDRHRGWDQIRGGYRIRDQPQVHLVLLSRKSPRKERRNPLRAATAKVRDQQEDLGALHHGRNMSVKGWGSVNT